MITFYRLYHVTHNLFSLKKQGIKLTKMINPKAKKQWYPNQPFDADTLPSARSLAKTKHEPGKRANRRVAMLNKLFMKHVTDLMSTGTVAIDIVGRGIEISKVQITPDFQTVNVFWVCKGNSTDVETESVLKRTAGALKHELSTLRVMGEVPYITFVKDKQEARVVELDRLLSVADYGEDYKPTEMGHLLKTEFTLDTRLSPEMKTKIKQLENEMPFEDDPIPEMTHDVFGLDHAKIMSRLLAARKKSRDAWLNAATDDVISYRAPAVNPNDEAITNQRTELADFLMKRQILQNKLRKQLRSDRQQLQVYRLDDGDGAGDDQPQDTEDEEDSYDDDDEYFYYEEAKTQDPTRPDTFY